MSSGVSGEIHYVDGGFHAHFCVFMVESMPMLVFWEWNLSDFHGIRVECGWFGDDLCVKSCCTGTRNAWPV